MSKPDDRVQLSKWETAAGGGDAGDDDGFPAPLDADEDAPDVRGVYFQRPGLRDKLVTVYRDADDKLWFEDVDHPGVSRLSLAALVGGGFDLDSVLVDDVTLAPLADDVTANLLVNA